MSMMTMRRTASPLSRMPGWLTKITGPLLVLMIWWIVTVAGLVEPRLLPSPITVAETALDSIATGALQKHLLISLGRAMTGLTIGVAVGVLLALIAGLSRIGDLILDSNLQMLRAMPILALLPLAIIWLGIGEELKIALVAMGAVFPIYLNTHAAIKSVDSKFVDLARTVGLSPLATIRRVILPSALPGFFTGLRFSVAVAWLVLVVSEQVNASAGIGFLMTQARSLGRTDTIVVGLVIYAILGLTSDILVRSVERKALQWRSTL